MPLITIHPRLSIPQYFLPVALAQVEERSWYRGKILTIYFFHIRYINLKVWRQNYQNLPAFSTVQWKNSVNLLFPHQVYQPKSVKAKLSKPSSLYLLPWKNSDY